MVTFEIAGQTIDFGAFTNLLEEIQTTGEPVGSLFGTTTRTVTSTSTGEIIPTSVLNQRIADTSLTNLSFTSIFDEIRTNIDNLIGLGGASLDISSALNEQITIREQQRAIDVEQANNQQIQINQLNERLSKQVSELGQAFSNIGSGGFDPIKFFTDNPLIGGIGVGGLAVAGIAIFLVLR